MNLTYSSFIRNHQTWKYPRHPSVGEWGDCLQDNGVLLLAKNKGALQPQADMGLRCIPLRERCQSEKATSCVTFWRRQSHAEITSVVVKAGEGEMNRRPGFLAR